VIDAEMTRPSMASFVQPGRPNQEGFVYNGDGIPTDRRSTLVKVGTSVDRLSGSPMTAFTDSHNGASAPATFGDTTQEIRAALVLTGRARHKSSLPLTLIRRGVSLPQRFTLCPQSIGDDP
jgi:hypothetical protein